MLQEGGELPSKGALVTSVDRTAAMHASAVAQGIDITSAAHGSHEADVFSNGDSTT